MSTVVNSIAQFNNAYKHYLLRNDEPLTDVVYAQALMFASRHSGRPLSDTTLAYVNDALARHALATARANADIPRLAKACNATDSARTARAARAAFATGCRMTPAEIIRAIASI